MAEEEDETLKESRGKTLPASFLALAVTRYARMTHEMCAFPCRMCASVICMHV